MNILPSPGLLLEQGHRDHYLPIIYFIPAIFTLYTEGREQIYHVVPAKLNLVPPNQILNKNPALFLVFTHQLLPALRYIRAIGAEDSVSPRKFLEAATNPEDSMLFYTGMYGDNFVGSIKDFFMKYLFICLLTLFSQSVAVYKFFEQRNVRLRGSPDFAPGR